MDFLYRIIIYLHVTSVIASIGPFFILLPIVKKIPNAVEIALEAHLALLKSVVRLAPCDDWIGYPTRHPWTMDVEDALDFQYSGAAVCLPVFLSTCILPNTSKICRRRREQAGPSRKIEPHHLDLPHSIDVGALVHGREAEFVVNKWKSGHRTRAFFTDLVNSLKAMFNTKGKQPPIISGC